MLRPKNVNVPSNRTVETMLSKKSQDYGEISKGFSSFFAGYG